MRKLTVFMLFISLTTAALGQTKPIKKVVKKEVEIACGQCMFKMEGKGCDLAVKFDEKGYYVDGRTIDAFGDAHADDGFCNAIRKAVVSGEIVKGRFKEKSIQLIDEKKPQL
jgi:hypothetical protein